MAKESILAETSNQMSALQRKIGEVAEEVAAATVENQTKEAEAETKTPSQGKVVAETRPEAETEKPAVPQ